MPGEWLRRAYLWACERLYHEFAWGYDAVAWLVSMGAWDAWRRAALDEVRGARVLETGSGTGALLAAMAVRQAAVGLEPSPAMLRVAVRRLHAQGSSGKVVQGSAERMPFAGQSFETVVATFPAPYIAEPATLAEVVRVLCPGGRLVVAGLWVTPQRGPLRLLPLFYGPRPERMLEALRERMRAAGLRMEWREAAVRGARVGVVVGTKQAGADRRSNAGV